MYISYKHNFIFIHIPKTGGSSITKFLVSELGESDIKRKNGHHLELRSFKRRIKDNTFKFCFVRNPWDTQVSWFFNSKKQFEQQSKAILSLPERVNIFKTYKNDREAFKKFITMSSISIDKHLKKGYKYNYVGRFERLEQDFKAILKLISINTTQRLPKVNSTKHNHYSYYYNNDTELIELVRKRNSKTINMFNYKFEDLEC